MNRLDGKVALITGASSGIGRASALLLASEGAAVVLGARQLQPLQAVVEAIREAGGTACAVAGDVQDDAYAQALVQQALQAYGGLDIALNNAGTLGPMGPTHEVAVDEWRAAVDTNLTGAFLGARHQLPALLQRGGGSLIFTSSFVGHTAGFPGVAAYAASKAGLIGLAQALAVEFGPSGLRVNALLPGGTETPLAHQMNGSPQALAAVASLHALRRLASPDEIAQAVLFLASDASSFITGSAMLVDGGVSVQRGMPG